MTVSDYFLNLKVDYLIKHLEQPKNQQQLLKIGAPTIAPLIKALKKYRLHPQSPPITEVLVQLNALAVPQLIAAVTHGGNDLIYDNLCVILSRIGKPAVLQVITALQKESDRQLVKILGMIADPRAFESLSTVLLGNGYFHLRKEAADALDKINFQPEKDALAAAYWITKRQIEKCIFIGTDAIEPLLIALKDYYDDVRESSAVVLGKIGDPRAIKFLVLALTDKQSSVRRAAASAILKIGTDEDACRQAKKFLVDTDMVDYYANDRYSGPPAR